MAAVRLRNADAATTTVHVCNVVPVDEQMHFSIMDRNGETHSTGVMSYGNCKALKDVDVGNGGTSTVLKSATWSGDFHSAANLRILQNGVDSMVILRPHSETLGEEFYATSAETATASRTSYQASEEYAVFVMNACIGNGIVEFTQTVNDISLEIDLVFKTGITINSVELSKADAETGMTKSFIIKANGIGDLTGGLPTTSPFGNTTIVVCSGIAGSSDFPPQLMVFGEPVQAGAATGVSLAVAAWAALMGASAIVSKHMQ